MGEIGTREMVNEAHLLLFYSILLYSFLLKHAFIENNQQRHAHGDAGIGEIEDGGEEVGAAPDGEAGGYGEQFDINHIHHASIEERGITAAVGEHRGQGGYRAFVENHAIEQAVNDIAQRAGDNQTEGDQHCPVHLVALNQAVHVPAEEHHQHDTEQGKQQLTEVLAETEAECHAGILDKIKIEPVSDKWDAFTEAHVCLDPDFENLVQQDERHHDGARNKTKPFVLFQRLISFFRSVLTPRRGWRGERF